LCNIALVSNGAWHYWVGVAEAGGTLRMYIDGTQCSTAAFTPPIATGTSELRIGRSPDVTLQDWTGGIDEVRVENIARPPEWIRAEHLSMRDTFLTFAPTDWVFANQ